MNLGHINKFEIKIVIELAVLVQIFQTTRNLVISCCCFAQEFIKKCMKNYNIWAQPLVSSLDRGLGFVKLPNENNFT